MQEWSLFTWNTQGDFTAPAKLAEIDAFFAKGKVIGFVQEGGVGKGGRQGSWVAFPGTSVGAFNQRCTNYVLVGASYARFVTIEPLYLVDGDQNLVVGGGQAGRTPAAIGIGDTLFVSWHSLAGHSNEDTASLIQAVESNPGYALKYRSIVVGGDFNASPEDIDGVLQRGTARTIAARTYKYRGVVRSGQKTHPGSDNELDFFVVLSQSALAADGPMAACRGVEMKAVAPSDHQPVRTVLFL